MNKALYVWFSPNFVKQTGHEIKTVGNPGHVGGEHQT